MKEMKLLLTGAWAGAKENKPELESMGHQVLFLQQEKEALPCSYDWVEGVVCNGLFQHHAIERFENLRFIQLTSAGTDRVSLAEIRRRGIEIHNAAGVYSIPMAEFALAGVLQLYKQSGFFYENQRKHRWEKHRGLLELHGKTVCIVGCGSVGTECAKRFQAFGSRVLGVNRTVSKEQRQYFDRIVGLDQLDQILSQADIVLISIALTEKTWHLMNADRFTCMKPGAILVNVARGAIVDQDLLIECLTRSQVRTDSIGEQSETGAAYSFRKGEYQLPALGGAVLDVFEEEPLSEDSILWDMDNVILTPHNSFVGDGNRKRLNDVILGNINHFFEPEQKERLLDL